MQMGKAKKPNIYRRIFKSRSRVIIFLILVVAVVFGWKYFAAKRNVKVKTARVYRGTVSEELILSGQILAEEHANLSFLSSGELDYIGVVEGQEVKKGDILVKLDSTNAYQTFLQAEADLRRYDASLAKTYDDVQGHELDESFAQREERTIAETNRDKAYRAYVIAKNNLSNLSLKAPFDGIVTSITHPFNGVNVSLSESQIEIVNPKTIYFEAIADQSEVTYLRVGQNVDILLDSFSQEVLDGEVSYISYTPKVGEIGTVYEVKVKLLTEPDTSVIRIGMSGDAKFILSEKSGVLYVPPEFVNTDIKGKYVNVGKPNNKVYVDVGIEGVDKVEIKGDIKEGDMIFD